MPAVSRRGAALKTTATGTRPKPGRSEPASTSPGPLLRAARGQTESHAGLLRGALRLKGEAAPTTGSGGPDGLTLSHRGLSETCRLTHSISSYLLKSFFFPCGKSVAYDLKSL